MYLKKELFRSPGNLEKFKAPEKVPFLIRFVIKSGLFEAWGDQGHFGGQDWSHFRGLKSHCALQMADLLLHLL